MKKKFLLPIMALACATVLVLPASNVNAINPDEVTDVELKPADENVTEDTVTTEIKEVDPKALSDTVAEAQEKLNKGGWTDESLSSANYSLLAALKILESDEATQEELDQANLSLVAALKDLQAKEEPKEETREASEEQSQDEPKKEMPETGAGGAELLSLIAIGGASVLGLRRKNK